MRGQPADAVSYQVQALAIRAALKSPDTRIDVYRLREQRDALGDEEFQHILSTLADRETVAVIMQLIERAD
jgi:hypothetical protein